VKLLEVKGLSASYQIGRRRERVLKRISFSLDGGERLAIVGESGSGKSTLASILLRLEPDNLVIEEGRVLFDGIDLTSASEEQLEKVRGKGISAVFQNPSSSLNPLYPVGEQIAEVLRENGYGKDEAKREAIELLRSVGIPNPEERYSSYPHQLSGGQKQRVAIARALSVRPRLIVGDEIVSALDATVKVQILSLMKELQKEFGFTLLFISHDLPITRAVSDRIVVMYMGKILEVLSPEELTERPMHPYTKHLLSSLPSIYLRGSGAEGKKLRLKELQGPPPERGCKLQRICPFATEKCFREEPPALAEGKDHLVFCHLYSKN